MSLVLLAMAKAENMKKVVKILLILFAISIVGIISFIIWFKHEINTKGFVVWNGTVYPETIDTEAKNTPEDTYAKFRQAILDDDVDGALEWVFAEKKEKYKKIFNDSEKIKKYKTLPIVNNIEKSKKNSYGNFSSYDYFEIVDSKKKWYSIEFQKDETGYWKIRTI